MARILEDEPVAILFMYCFFRLYTAEENQQLCTSTFPVVRMWLQEFTQLRKEMVQPICSLVAMIVANNCE